MTVLQENFYRSMLKDKVLIIELKRKRIIGQALLFRNPTLFIFYQIKEFPKMPFFISMELI